MLIKIMDSVSNYQEAIKITCDMLENGGFIKPEYYDAILRKIKEFGPYFCLMEGVCMPHARPEDGTINQSMAILKLDKPIDFEGKPIKIFFTLAAKDSTSHMDLLQIVSGVCGNTETLEKVFAAKSENEIKKIIESIGE